MSSRIIRIDRCANGLCPNLPDEGAFEVLIVETHMSVGCRAEVQLVLCSPCASALKGGLK